ncbi:MAG: zinc ribbon domain-containing protein [Actinomycetota bacterium]|nr:zinc ribbon domain-containing protein [Actinomycetota bacterium]
MPVYEYRCRDCGHEFEALRPVGAASDVAACPNGHDDTVRRLSLVAPTPRPTASSGPAPCCAGGCACAAGSN